MGGGGGGGGGREVSIFKLSFLAGNILFMYKKREREAKMDGYDTIRYGHADRLGNSLLLERMKLCLALERGFFLISFLKKEIWSKTSWIRKTVFIVQKY